MKDIIEKLDRILELTDDYGIYVDSRRGNAEHESELPYNMQKVRFNAIKALELINSEDKEITAMEKQPEYEYLPIELSEIGEWVDGSWCYAADLHFEWSRTNIVPISEVSAIELIKNPHKLVQKVELTPERKREKEVEELTQDIQRLLEMDTGRAVLQAAKAIAKYVSDNFVKMG